MTQGDDTERLLEAVAALAREAGRRILEVYATDFAVAHKDDRSPLTEADMASHRTLVEGLRRLTPEIPVLSEESASVPFHERARWTRFWLVDPLDGTKEFVKRNGEFTVNVALVEGHAPVLGVVHAPVLDRTYLGARGLGAFRLEGGRGRRPIRVRCPAAEPPAVAGSRSHATPELAAYLERLGPHELRSIGSSLKFCLVAEGSADLYPRLGPTSEWDTAAAQAVVEAAGGHVVDTGGRPLRYNTGDSLLNPHFLVYGDPARDWLAPLRGD
ncbi:3'(2'),5'-bisphosphate nucleotidase CysQ [Inmirania thermothiophila]|uniref:3'(2'),5'-bisphosphate nucleotidase CysQ n=1 Tax=Inmirania thermothiophila TaxID=1750597 RepID=A0A3N1XSD4_9GAMM|nr:3'(2'),5'-bisphosphate nucleotidase CysQ [Inmirania thermothiophila]ROR29556.1 3'(2'),5'-bisphosphate nucleotidase [Inmirania thermothiophila]